MRLFLSLFVIAVPLIAYTAYSSYVIISNRNESIAKMKDNNVDSDKILLIIM